MLDRRAVAVTILEHLVHASATIENDTVKTAYDAISERLAKTIDGLGLTKITTGAFADLSERVTMGALLKSVRLANTDEIRDIRTIHKAKGIEASHVLVCLHGKTPEQAEQRLNHILNPSPTSDEEQRIRMSRSAAPATGCSLRHLVSRQGKKNVRQRSESPSRASRQSELRDPLSPASRDLLGCPARVEDVIGARVFAPAKSAYGG